VTVFQGALKKGGERWNALIKTMEDRGFREGASLMLPPFYYIKHWKYFYFTVREKTRAFHFYRESVEMLYVFVFDENI